MRLSWYLLIFGIIVIELSLLFSIAKAEDNLTNESISNITLYNTTYICDRVYYFAISHLTNYTVIYTEDELTELTNKISNETNMTTPLEIVSNYTNNFEDLCNKTLFIKNNNSNNLTNQVITTKIKKHICPINLSGDLRILVTDIPIYKSVDFPNFEINIGEVSCSQVDFWKYIFDIEYSDTITNRPNMIWVGVRVYILVIIILILLVIAWFIFWKKKILRGHK